MYGDKVEGTKAIIYFDGEPIGEMVAYDTSSEPAVSEATYSEELVEAGEAMCKCNQCGASTYAPFHTMGNTLEGRIWELTHNCDNDTWAWSSERLSGY